MYEYSYSYNINGVDQTVLGTAVIFALIIALIQLAAMWKIFTKAGKPGWYSIVPILNVYTYYEISWGNGWMFLLNFLAVIPFVGFVVALVITVMTASKLAKAFGKGTGFTLGLIFLEPIFIMLLGFGNNEYYGPAVQARPNPYNVPTEDPMLKNQTGQTVVTPNMSNPQLGSNQSIQNNQPQNTPVKYCKNCGVQLNPGAKFCQVCGIQVDNQ